ncbi:uncharacterized protein LOC127705150 [Mytilus californianus]|uniref:uncharacterized protein LOC127705150 n=1 Tax=Mytilus californianus TaxID=6549 RepID=UPI0022453027|nr:uncharacterized protein LOC127705150 [Mytilus californianus]
MTEGSKSVEQWLEGLSGVHEGHTKQNFKNCSTNSETTSYLGDSYYPFPSRTSKWNISCLESLGIFYNKKYHDSPQDLLNMIFEETGAFRPVSEEQKCNATDIKKRMTFNFPISDIVDMLTDKEKVTLNNGESFFPEIEHDIDKCSSADIREFIFSCQLMLSCRAAFFYDWRENIEPKDMFVQMLEKFARLCQLIAVPGSACSAKKTIMTLQNVSVTSQADLVMIPEKYRRGAFSACVSATCVVSVVEVNNLNHKKSEVEMKKAAQHGRSSTEAGEMEGSEKPQIYTKVHADILAQHGGDLLIHRQLYCSTLSSSTTTLYLPGMVVVGSEVIFTLLKILRKHVMQLKEQRDTTLRATIYYSKPKDMLKKEDRDELIEALTRISNV